MIKFNSDEIDETDILASLLENSAISPSLDLTVRSLPGDHARPMQPTVMDLPPEVTRAANTAFNTGGGIIRTLLTIHSPPVSLTVGFCDADRLSEMAANAGQAEGSEQLDRLSKGVAGMASAFSNESKNVFSARIAILADEVAAWMGVGGIVSRGPKFLSTKQSDAP